MDKYVLDGQYGKYLEMVGIKVGEALKTAGVPEDLFSHKKRIIAPMRYEISETAVSSTNMRTQIAEYYARETGIYF
jgi:hypothetical protein